MNIESLLNFEQPLDIGLLDYAVQSFYTGDATTQKRAQEVLTVFQNHNDTWQAVPNILQLSKSIQTKFLALRIMENFIVVRWNTIPLELRIEIRNYIVQLVVDACSKNVNLPEDQSYLNKLNIILVQIIKKDWPKHWPNFISDIIEISKTDLSYCENNMKILQLLSEEIFEYSEDQMSMSNMRRLVYGIIKESKLLLDFCIEIITNNSLPESLIETTLKATSRFITWIPLDEIMDERLIEKIGFWKKRFPTLVIQCYIEIANLSIPDTIYSDQLYSMYQSVLSIASGALPLNLDIISIYDKDNANFQEFIRFTSLFFTTFLSKKPKIAFNQQVEYTNVHELLLNISKIDDKEIWKICLEYWETYVDRLDKTNIHVNSEIINELRQIILLKIGPPNEVLVVEDDDGDVTKEYNKENETSTLFQSTKKVLCSITSLDISATLNLIGTRLSTLMSTNNFSWIEFNKLCWAIGSISSVIDLENENRFLETIMQGLTVMVEKTAPSDVSYMITSCLVYIGSQYPRFLASHTGILNFILDKLFSYMQEPLDDIRDMACESFLKITKDCKDVIASQSDHSTLESSSSLTWNLINNIDQYVKPLNKSQICSFYQAIGYLISATPPDSQFHYVSKLMQVSNTTYRSLLNDLTMKTDNINLLKSISIFISINDSLCITIGSLYSHQFYDVLDCLIGTYQYIKMVALSKKGNFTNVIEYSLIKKIRTEINKLTRHYVIETNVNQIKNMNQFNELIQTIMDDHRTLENESDPIVLELLTSILDHFGNLWPTFLDSILQYVFEPTLKLITQNFTDYPDHRLGFYKLLNIINKRYLAELINLPDNQLSIIIDSILWGTKHTVNDISSIALQTCLEFINQVSQIDDEDISSALFQKFYLKIFTDTLTILVDPDCQNGFHYQSQILARLLELIKEGEIYTQIFDVNQVSDPLMSNTVFLQEYVKNLFNQSYPLFKDKTESLVLGMFEYCDDIVRFESDLKDFLVDIREVGDEETEQQQRNEIIDAELELLKFV
ncbi:unnamed protein product [Cunninghamella blakesleeana]